MLVSSLGDAAVYIKLFFIVSPIFFILRSVWEDSRQQREESPSE